ncbi:SipW-dependent-type signal peptide-containing protein [Nakamurella leprariae]|uniref:SipW-cognate class signal peptide n=1 Tax=Nakamurella leprariae TaxID=2803911 RepID=A0A939BXX4_9ACTN|nr:SipW-dependent-type signal peptide-containing protein [Nakamurella leprariae]MBM9466031.1 hypothetical protein [Nakamurella leprariae]
MTQVQDATRSTRRQRRGKVRAVLAGCAALGVGAAVTLAAWTDTEWVFGGGQGDGDTVGTSTFNVQQNVFDGVGFTDRSATPGGQLRFAPGATSITPGDVITAPMQLQTEAGSDAGTVTLEPAALNGSDQALFDAVTYAAYTGLTAAECSAADLAGGTALVPDNSGLATGSADDAIALDADQGNVVDVCFVITLPDDAPNTLQGLTIAPAWEFSAESVE